MSIRIETDRCSGCGRCCEVCPGNLIRRSADGKADIRRRQDCWGCTSCLKECKTGAILFYLGADIGGRGSVLSVSQKGDIKIWSVTDPGGNVQKIAVNSKESNQY